MTMAAATLVLASCGSDDHEVIDTWNGEIRLHSGVETQQLTRGIGTDLQGTQIADGNHVGFFINDAVTDGAVSTDLDYTANGTGGFNGTAVYYPQSGNSVNIYAYAPWKTGLTLDGTYAFSVQTDQSADAGYLASDLLWGQPMKLQAGSTTDYESANPVARSKNAVNVSFTHLLSKIEVTLIPGDGLTANDFKGATLKILNVLPGTNLTLNSGTISAASGNATDITAATYSSDVTALTAAAIIVPQPIASEAKFLQVHLTTGGDLFYTLPSDAALTLESGKIYKYEITVKLTGLTVTSGISPWQTIGANPIEGNAVMD